MGDLATELEKIEEKLEAGETLTPEEEDVVRGVPADDPTESPEDKGADEKKLEKLEGKDDDADKGSKKAEKQESGDKKRKEGESEEDKEAEAAKVLQTIEDELAKDNPREFIDGIDSQNQGLYRRMRLDRKTRQKAEVDRDSALFEVAKLKQKLEGKDEKAEEKKEEVEDILSKMEDDELLTAKEARALMKQIDQKIKPPEAAGDNKAVEAAWYQRFLDVSEQVARKTYDDYDVIIGCAEKLMEKSDYDALAEAMKKGDNPAVFMYERFKDHDNINDVKPEVIAKLKKATGSEQKPEKKEDDKSKKAAEEAEKKLKENEKKPKTSGHVSGSEAEGGEAAMSLEKLANMSDAEFRALPREDREKYLKMLG